ERWETRQVSDYNPYGIVGNYVLDWDKTEEKFTGKQHDAGNLSYFGARYYQGPTIVVFSSENPRWISADSAMAHTYDPPSLNKYAYVRNTPVNLVDPNGKAIACWEDYRDEDEPYGISCVGGVDPPGAGAGGGGQTDARDVFRNDAFQLMDNPYME